MTFYRCDSLWRINFKPSRRESHSLSKFFILLFIHQDVLLWLWVRNRRRPWKPQPTSSNTVISFVGIKRNGATLYYSTFLDLMLTDYNWTFTLIPFNINTALRRIFSKDLSDIEGCSSRLCQMRSVLTIMVRSSGGAASQLHNSLTASIILCSVSIEHVDICSLTRYKLQMHHTHIQGVPYH